MVKRIQKSYLIYGGILLGFSVWMLFIDTHSWALHSELSNEINQLELKKEALKKVIVSDKKTIKLLENKDSLERFAREQYGHKKEKETVFIIEAIDSMFKK
jgi:cell division protein FtsB